MADTYGVQFDEVNDYFNLADNAAWDIVRADGSQFYAFWMDVQSNAGAVFQYFFSSGSFRATESINLFIPESSSSDSPNSFRATSETNTQDVTTAAQTFPTGRILVVYQYNATTGNQELVLCDEGGSAVRYSATSSLSNDIVSSVWNLGRRADGNTSRYFGGIIFNLAKGTGFLSDANVTSLASDIFSYDRALLDTFATTEIFFPMNEGTGQNITDDVLGLTGTGIGFPTDDSQWINIGGPSGYNSYWTQNNSQVISNA